MSQQACQKCLRCNGVLVGLVYQSKSMLQQGADGDCAATAHWNGMSSHHATVSFQWGLSATGRLSRMDMLCIATQAHEQGRGTSGAPANPLSGVGGSPIAPEGMVQSMRACARAVLRQGVPRRLVNAHVHVGTVLVDDSQLETPTCTPVRHDAHHAVTAATRAVPRRCCNTLSDCMGSVFTLLGLTDPACWH